MPRPEVGTPKWLSNKMKGKGLQRLRWYCQMCEKQCRDENGFKCHMNSESHLRMMQVFGQCAGRFIDQFSRAFEADFMRLMRTRYCRARVLANTVYCEMIANKDHVHMNATAWVTLNGFIRHLEESGQIKVDWGSTDDPSTRGPYISYIDREQEAKDKAASERLKKYVSPEELEERRLKELEKHAKEQQVALEPAESASSPVNVSASINIRLPKPKTDTQTVKPTSVSALFKRTKKR